MKIRKQMNSKDRLLFRMSLQYLNKRKKLELLKKQQ